MNKIKVLETIQHEAESVEIVGSIDDLLIEIFLRLPVKSLLGFKIVSKHWHSLITNPEFLRRRNSKHNYAVGPLFDFDYVPFFPKDATINPIRRFQLLSKDLYGVTILHSCNGLLLCCNNTKYYVYNPTTNQYTTLPKVERACGMSLAFDPAKSPHYKVVCVYTDQGLASRPVQFLLQIYSSEETGAWRVSGERFTARANIRNGVYWNGAVHWIGYPGEDAHTLYFDIHRDVLEKMPNPPPMQICLNEMRMDYYFGESCGHLHYFEIPQIHFNVYEMKRDRSEWFVKYHVDLSPVVGGMNFDPMDSDYHDFSIYTIVRGEEEESSFIVMHIFEKAIRYNIVPKTFKKLHEFEVVEDKNFSCSGFHVDFSILNLYVAFSASCSQTTDQRGKKRR